MKAGLGPDNAAVIDIALNPVDPLVAAGDVVLIHAEGRTSAGAPAPLRVDWAVSDGTLIPMSDSVAEFSALTPGIYRVYARGTEPPYPVDSTSITVVATISPVVGLALTPSSVNLSFGEGVLFGVTALRQDGSSFVPSVTYSATGGTITSGGLYTAGATAGTFRVIATQQGGSLADTSIVTLMPPLPPGSNPHEPSGMTLGFDEAWTTTPPTSSWAGWYTEVGASYVSVVADATSPSTDHKVLQLKFPTGFHGGYAPMVLTWNEGGHFPTNTGTLYMRMRVKIDPNWSDNGNTRTKFIWPRPMIETTNHVLPITTFSAPNMKLGFILQADYLGGVDTEWFEPGTNAAGTWHDVEYLLYQGSSGAANNGTVKIWVDGTLVLSQANIKYAHDTDTLGWKYMSLSPTFGAGTNPVPHDQYIWIDHWYASVK